MTEWRNDGRHLNLYPPSTSWRGIITAWGSLYVGCHCLRGMRLCRIATIVQDLWAMLSFWMMSWLYWWKCKLCSLPVDAELCFHFRHEPAQWCKINENKEREDGNHDYRDTANWIHQSFVDNSNLGNLCTRVGAGEIVMTVKIKLNNICDKKRIYSGCRR